MTDEERSIITAYIARVSGAARPASATSVPVTIDHLPPIDPEADRLIGDLFQQYPEARYRLTQTAFVQEHALAEAQSRIAQLQAELQQARATPQAAPQQSGGFFSSVFGNRAAPQTPPPPPPQQQPYAPYPPAQTYGQAQPQYASPPPPYAPQYQGNPGMFGRAGSGFLGSALTTAAGVAGGMVAGNALMNLFDGHRGYGEGFGGGFGGGAPMGYEQGFAPGAAGPWGGQPDAQVTGSAWDNATEDSQPAGWDQSSSGGTPDAGWDQGGGDSGGGGWDDGGNNNSF